MRLSSIKPYSEIYGFEPCFVVWTQGCNLACKGCWNKNTWDIKGGFELSVQEIFEKIKNQIDSKEFPIQALTILGGEPFLQYRELEKLMELIKPLDIGTIVYSGYEKEELIKANKCDIFNKIDVLIYGRYIESLRDTSLQLRGSSNQVIDFLSNRYSANDIKEGNYFEIDINSLGDMDIVGYPDILNNEYFL